MTSHTFLEWDKVTVTLLRAPGQWALSRMNAVTQIFQKSIIAGEIYQQIMTRSRWISSFSNQEDSNKYTSFKV